MINFHGIVIKIHTKYITVPGIAQWWSGGPLKQPVPPETPETDRQTVPQNVESGNKIGTPQIAEIGRFFSNEVKESAVYDNATLQSAFCCCFLIWKVLDVLKETHSWLCKENESEVRKTLEQRGWMASFDLQPDVPFPERR